MKNNKLPCSAHAYEDCCECGQEIMNCECHIEKKSSTSHLKELKEITSKLSLYKRRE